MSITVVINSIILASMHTYSINGKERNNVLGSIGILSMLIIWSIHHYLPDGVPVPSVFALFGTLVFVFDKWLWRWKLFQKMFVKTPDLNGNWVVSSQSSIIYPEKVYNATLTIKQTWTHIHVFFDGEKSTSESVMAGIEIKTDDMLFLKWEYRAEYKPTFADDPNNKIHYGMTKLMMKPVSRPDEMGGNYYTDENRKSHGPMALMKIKKLSFITCIRGVTKLCGAIQK